MKTQSAFSETNKLAQNILETLKTFVKSNYCIQVNPFYLLSYTDYDTIIIDYAKDEVVINPKNVSLIDRKALIGVALDLMTLFEN